jgi:hypothetical protein
VDPIKPLTLLSSHGLPESWVNKYLKLPKNHYACKIRGNDCYAFLGQQQNGTRKTCTDDCEKMLVELEPVHLSLGPNPGSFFAHIGSLKRYRWRNLPEELEDIMQEVTRKKYGTIHDVAINAAGGWVIQFDEGAKYRMGGVLPAQLHDALLRGTKNKTQIRVCADYW